MNKSYIKLNNAITEEIKEAVKKSKFGGMEWVLGRKLTKKEKEFYLEGYQTAQGDIYE